MVRPHCDIYAAYEEQSEQQQISKVRCSEWQESQPRSLWLRDYLYRAYQWAGCVICCGGTHGGGDAGGLRVGLGGGGEGVGKTLQITLRFGLWP